MVQSGRTFLEIEMKPITSGWCCFKSKVKNIQIGVNYFDHTSCFPLFFKRFIKEQTSTSIMNSHMRSLIKPVNESETSKEFIIKDMKPISSETSPSKRVSLNKRVTDLGGGEIIYEVEVEEDKQDQGKKEGTMPQIQVDMLFHRRKINFSDTNNLSQHFQTVNDEKVDKDQSKLDKDFEKMNDNEDENIMNEIEEELKEGMLSVRALERLQSHALSPITNKCTPSHFIDKKNSIDLLQMNSQEQSYRDLEYYTNNPRGFIGKYFTKFYNKFCVIKLKIVTESDENEYNANVFLRNKEFDSSITKLRRDSNANKESSTSLVKNFAEEKVLN